MRFRDTLDYNIYRFMLYSDKCQCQKYLSIVCYNSNPICFIFHVLYFYFCILITRHIAALRSATQIIMSWKLGTEFLKTMLPLLLLYTICYYYLNPSLISWNIENKTFQTMFPKEIYLRVLWGKWDSVNNMRIHILCNI